MFPGCLVGVKGRNGGGKLFSVSEVLMVRSSSHRSLGRSLEFLTRLERTDQIRAALKLPPIEPTYTKPSELLANQHGPNDNRQKQLAGAPLTAFVAAGPYTVDSDLEFAPLGALLEQVEREKPDVLILVRPSHARIWAVFPRIKS